MLAASGPGRWPQWFGGAVVLAGLVQLALFAYATAPGLAGTGDSGYYLHAAQTFRATGHLLNPDGTAYRYWPPLYPVLLSGCGSLAGIRVLHGGCLLGSLLLWSWLGQHLLLGRRAALLPWLLALSTPWLLVSKFVWAESAFLLVFAAYAASLFQWLRTGRRLWWGVATAVGFLLPLQRTLGLFLLAGVGAGVLLGEWRRLPVRSRWLLTLHLVMSTVGGMLWQWYALLVAGPSRYHPGRGWGQLLSSAADYGFVLGRWLLPLPTAGRALLPHGVWAVALLLILGLLWPRRRAEAGLLPEVAVSKQNDNKIPRRLLLRILWTATVSLVALVSVLTVFAQSAAGLHDAERYASVLFAPLLVLTLAAWPARAPHWLQGVVITVWLFSTALRAGHVAADLHRLPPITPDLWSQPGPHGQHIGAASQ
ncbi:hypothetical protein [Hymenobacter terrenus]|uniref:hypothetical protein n=1 Tax=Hymenobacter terrenus TaxID=1629124 RepID=UPI000619BCB8|nr:hypothetical protein [Hymenobacter terrenus]